MSGPATSPAEQRPDLVLPPAWARMVDYVCLILLLLVLVVAEFGGFRERLGSIRIALTSPLRLLIVAVGLAAVRHYLLPRPAIHTYLPRLVKTGLTTTQARVAWGALVGTRPAILFVGYLAVVMFGYNHSEPPLRLSHNEVENLQVRWDMAWYFGIATDGYKFNPANRTAQQNIVFFPAFPTAMRLAGRLLGGQTMAFVAGGTIVAFACFFWGLVYLFRLARELTGDDEPARFAIWLTAVYPFALFFSAIYTESLYLLGATAAFFHFRRREFWAAGAWGLLVGLTRPNGCFLSIPLAVLAIAPWLPAWLNGGTAIDRQPSQASIRSLMPALAAAAMPGIGVLLFSAYTWNLTGNPIAWAEGHAAWGRTYRGFGGLIADRYDWLVNDGLYVYSSQLPLDLLNLLGALFVLVAVWPVARRLGLAFAIFILINILPPMAAGGMLSIGRLSSVLFPAFIWLATVIPVRQRSGWLASFMAIQAFNAALFYTWRELY
jgi:hypothetical protein